MPKAYNKRYNPPSGAIYVGRPTKWGNPYSHLDNTIAAYKVKTRDEAVEKYREWILTQPELLKSLSELKGKDLVCWCAPLACHAEVLIEMANVEDDDENGSEADLVRKAPG